VKCPSCSLETGSEVIDSRKRHGGIWRLRKCKSCNETFTTIERPHVFKPIPHLLHKDLTSPVTASLIHARRVASRRAIEDAATLKLDEEFE
jgi:hypothetical protein